MDDDDLIWLPTDEVLHNDPEFKKYFYKYAGGWVALEVDIFLFSLSLSFFAFLLRGLFLFHGLVGPLVGARRHFLSVCHLLSR